MLSTTPKIAPPPGLGTWQLHTSTTRFLAAKLVDLIDPQELFPTFEHISHHLNIFKHGVPLGIDSTKLSARSGG